MYRIVNIGGYDLGQQATTTELPAPTTPKTSGGSGTPAPATYGCPFTPPGAAGQAAFAVTTDPTLNCMRDARGNAICSDGSHYPPGCPHTPPPEVFSPGITPDVTTNGRIEGQIPPPRGGAAAPAPAAPGAAAAPSSGPSPALMVGAGALGAGLLAAGAYFLFLK